MSKDATVMVRGKRSKYSLIGAKPQATDPRPATDTEKAALADFVEEIENNLVKLESELAAKTDRSVPEPPVAHVDHGVQQLDGSSISCCSRRKEPNLACEGRMDVQVGHGSSMIHYSCTTTCVICGGRKDGRCAKRNNKVSGGRRGCGRDVAHYGIPPSMQPGGIFIRSKRTRCVQLDGERGEEVVGIEGVVVEDMAAADGGQEPAPETPRTADESDDDAREAVVPEVSSSVVTNPGIYFDAAPVDGVSELSESDGSEFGEGEHLKFPSSPTPDPGHFSRRVASSVRTNRSEPDVATPKGP